MLGDAACPGGCTGSFKVKESSVVQSSSGPHSFSPSFPLWFCLLILLIPSITDPSPYTWPSHHDVVGDQGRQLCRFFSALRESRGPSIIGSSIEPIGPSKRGRGNNSIPLESNRELLWGASAWPLRSPLCPPQGYYQCPQFTWLSQGSFHTVSFTQVETLIYVEVQNGSHPFISQRGARPCNPKDQKVLPYYSISSISKSSPGEEKALRCSSLSTAHMKVSS